MPVGPGPGGVTVAGLGLPVANLKLECQCGGLASVHPAASGLCLICLFNMPVPVSLYPGPLRLTARVPVLPVGPPSHPLRLLRRAVEPRPQQPELPVTMTAVPDSESEHLLVGPSRARVGGSDTIPVSAANL